jgi:predicted short-subunit dehydrogenase-like oxidoreductase (DUF2520 family)
MRAKKLSTSSRAQPEAWSTTIVGGGMVGSIFGRLLAESGAPPDLVVSRTSASARRAARFSGAARASRDLGRLSARTRLIIVATPHAAVSPVAAALAALPQLDFARLFVCHASGMLTAAALAPVAERGARVFSFHPLQSFPRIYRPATLLPSARGITYGIDGGDTEALRMARRLARRLGGRALLVPPHLRVYYHAASVVASTHLAALTSILAEMYAQITGATPTGPITENTGSSLKTKKASRDNAFYAIYEPLLQGTLGLVKARSPREALGGAIARGGVETLTEHLGAVSTHSPALVLPFAALCVRAIELVRQGGTLPPERIDAMLTAVTRVADLDTFDLAAHAG